jgi:hypothetical protein
MSQAIETIPSNKKYSNELPIAPQSRWTVEKQLIIAALAAIALTATYITLAFLFPEVMIPLTAGIALCALPFGVSGAWEECCCPRVPVNHND